MTSSSVRRIVTVYRGLTAQETKVDVNVAFILTARSMRLPQDDKACVVCIFDLVFSFLF